MSKLHFDEASHQYTLFEEGGGAMPLLSVSQILHKADMYGYPTGPLSQEKMQFGTQVHKLTEMNDDGVIGYEDLEDRERGHIEAYEKFKRDTNLEIIHTEATIYHPLYMYGAKPDRIAVTNMSDQPCVLEIKTGRPHPANLLQLSAYLEAYNAMPDSDPKVSWSLAVYLSDDGNYKTITNEDHDKNFSLFLSCLQIIRWRDKHGIGKARRYGSG